MLLEYLKTTSVATFKIRRPSLGMHRGFLGAGAYVIFFKEKKGMQILSRKLGSVL